MDTKRDDRDHITGEKVGVYVHIPFCRSKCIYCDFPSFSGQDELHAPYMQCLFSEVRSWQSHEKKVRLCDTVFIGGGTPSIVPSELIEKLLDTLREKFSLDDDAEITIEANPESLTSEKLHYYKRIGINRISIGVQSFNDEILDRVGRLHTSDQAVESFQNARKVGFSNISIDLIAGLPGHTLESFSADVDGILRLRPEHVSIYLLETDRDTPLWRYAEKGEIDLPDDETMLELSSAASAELSANGYIRYEISNYALPGKRCRHNLKYWSDELYIGFGSSAHSFIDGMRTSNTDQPVDYIRSIMGGGEAIVQREEFHRAKRVSEALFMGLRMMRGVDVKKIHRKYGIDVMREYAKEIGELKSERLLTMEEDRLRLTERGIIFSNEVFSRFV